VDGVAATFALVLLRDETVRPAVGFPANHQRVLHYITRSGLDGPKAASRLANGGVM
jgi:hypothetical protein